MFGGIMFYEHEEKAMKMLLKETIWYHNYEKLMCKIFDMEHLTAEQHHILRVAILKCGIAMGALGDIISLVEMRQWCNSQDNLSLLLKQFRSKFYHELSETADEVTLFKSYFEAFKEDAECLGTKSIDDSYVFLSYDKFKIEALFEPTSECTVAQNENMDVITKIPEISNKKRKCPFVDSEYGTESCKTLEIHPSNMFAGNEFLLMDRSKSESSKAMDYLMGKTRQYDGYVQCMNEFARKNWEQRELIRKVVRKFILAFQAVTRLMFQVERREWCDKLDQVYQVIDGFEKNLDEELAKIDNKCTKFKVYVEKLKSEGKFLRGSYLYPHLEYFEILAMMVHSRLYSDSEEEKSDLTTEFSSPMRHEDNEGVVKNDYNDIEYLFD